MAVFGLGAVGLIFGYAVFKWGGVEPQDWYLCLTALGLCCFIYWIFAKQRRPVPPLSVLLRVTLAAFFLTCVLQLIPLPVPLVNAVSPSRTELNAALAPVVAPLGAVTLSVSPSATFALLLTLASYILVFLFIRSACWRLRERPWLIAAPFLVVAFAEAVIGLLQVHLSGAPEATGTYVNRNHYAGLLELALPFPVMQAVALVRSDRRDSTGAMTPAVAACLLIAVATVLLLACLLSLSRMGFIASLTALLIMGLTALWGTLRGFQKWIPALGVVLIILLGFIFLPSDQLIGRFADIAETESLSSDMRTEIWSDTLKLIRAFPVFGCGLGGYESGFCRYQVAAPLLTVDAAHNDYLQLWAELGIVGFVILLFLAVLMFRNSFRAAYRYSGNARYVAIACAGSLTAIALHSLVDFNLYIPSNAMLVVWIAAISEGLKFFTIDSGRSDARRRSRSSTEGREVKTSANL